MEKKRSVGVTIFGILLILGSLFQIVFGLDFSKYSFLFQPLPKQIITMRYFITIIMSILSLISGMGVLFLKDFFRKTALIIASYSIFTYLIEGPFFCFRNFPKFVEQSLAETIAKAPNISSSILSLTLWVSTILFWAIDFSFAICLIYFFTRPKVKEQFKKEEIPNA